MYIYVYVHPFADKVAQNLEIKSKILSAFQRDSRLVPDIDNVLITIPCESWYAWYKIESL